jgi:threonine/homoserine/homoserine lactone efflux protein
MFAMIGWPGLRGGFGPALNVQLGSIIGDFMWFLIALIGLGPLAQISWVRAPLAIAGVVVLLYLGASGIRDAVRTKISTPPMGGTRLKVHSARA